MHPCKLVLHYIDSWFALFNMLSDFFLIFLCICMSFFVSIWIYSNLPFHRNDLVILLHFICWLYVLFAFSLNFFQFALHSNYLVIFIWFFAFIWYILFVSLDRVIIGIKCLARMWHSIEFVCWILMLVACSF